MDNLSTTIKEDTNTHTIWLQNCWKSIKQVKVKVFRWKTTQIYYTKLPGLLYVRQIRPSMPFKKNTKTPREKITDKKKYDWLIRVTHKKHFKSCVNQESTIMVKLDTFLTFLKYYQKSSISRIALILNMSKILQRV